MSREWSVILAEFRAFYSADLRGTMTVGRENANGYATANVGEQATFDQSGRANSHRHYVAYWLMLERADQMIFQAWAGLQPDPLVQAGDNFLGLRVPLRTMGVTDARHNENHDRRRAVAEERDFQP